MIKPCLHVAEKIAYAKRIFPSVTKILSVRNYQRTVQNFQRTSKKQKKKQVKVERGLKALSPVFT